MSFCKRLESETSYRIRDFVVMNNYPNQDVELNQHKKRKQNNDQNDQNDQNDVNMTLNFTDVPADYYRNIFN